MVTEQRSLKMECIEGPESLRWSLRDSHHDLLQFVFLVDGKMSNEAPFKVPA